MVFVVFQHPSTGVPFKVAHLVSAVDTNWLPAIHSVVLADTDTFPVVSDITAGYSVEHVSDQTISVFRIDAAQARYWPFAMFGPSKVCVANCIVLPSDKDATIKNYETRNLNLENALDAEKRALVDMERRYQAMMKTYNGVRSIKAKTVLNKRSRKNRSADSFDVPVEIFVDKLTSMSLATQQ